MPHVAGGLLRGPGERVLSAGQGPGGARDGPVHRPGPGKQRGAADARSGNRGGGRGGPGGQLGPASSSRTKPSGPATRGARPPQDLMQPLSHPTATGKRAQHAARSPTEPLSEPNSLHGAVGRTSGKQPLGSAEVTAASSLEGEPSGWGVSVSDPAKVASQRSTTMAYRCGNTDGGTAISRISCRRGITARMRPRS